MHKAIIKLIFPIILVMQYSCNIYTNVYHKIQPINLASLVWEDEDWPNEPFRDYLYRCLDYQTNMQEIKKRKIVFELYKKSVEVDYHNSLYDVTTIKDLQLLSAKRENDPYLANLIDRTNTQLGKVFLYGLVANPTTDINLLQNRQSIIRFLIDNPDFYAKLDCLYKRLSSRENLLLSMWGQDGFLHATQRHYFSIPFFQKCNEFLNRSPYALEIRSLWGHEKRAMIVASGVLASVVLPLYAFSLQSKIELPNILQNLGQRLQGAGGPFIALLSTLIDHENITYGSMYAAGMICALAFKEEYEWARDNIILDICLQTKMIAIADFLNCVEELETCLQTNAEFLKISPAIKKVAEIMEETTKEKCKHLFELCKSETFDGEPSFFSVQGRVLAAYKLIYDCKEQLEPMLLALGQLDAYISCAKLYKEFSNQKVKFCFVNYIIADQPQISLYNFWNPFIDPDVVIPNTIDLNGACRRNLIITGPNAGGKSTIIKAVPINLILAQSIGLVAAESASITPFFAIGTYLNIVDDIAAGNSLFKAQVLRAQEIVHMVENTPEKQFSFTALDEMFNGTSAIESMATAYSVVNHIGKYTNNISIIATHFPLLTILENETEAFANYKVSVNIKDSKIYYPFTLEKGISNQHIALNILQQEGFDSTILAQATTVLQSINLA